MLHTLDSFNGNYSGFLRLRERRVDKIPFLTKDLRTDLLLKEQGGYDGQWYYYIAFDPFLNRFSAEPQKYHEILDAPPYRLGRIGFPLLTKILSRDHPPKFPKTMVLLILGFNLVGAAFFLKILEIYGRSPYWTLLYLLIPSTTACLNLGVPEAMAMAMLLGGLYFYLRGKFALSVLFFSYSLLVRETGVLFLLVLMFLELFKERRPKVALMMASSVVPYLGWKLFLTWRLFGEYGWETLYYSPGDFTFPFGGVFDLYVTNWSKSSSISGLLFFPALVILNFLFSLVFLRQRRNIFSLALFGYCLLHLSLNYHKIWGHIRDLERTMSDGFLFLMLAFFALPSESKPTLRYSFLAAVVLLLAYKLFYSPIAPSFQAGFNLLRAFR